MLMERGAAAVLRQEVQHDSSAGLVTATRGNFPAGGAALELLYVAECLLRFIVRLFFEARLPFNPGIVQRSLKAFV